MRGGAASHTLLAMPVVPIVHSGSFHVAGSFPQSWFTGKEATMETTWRFVGSYRQVISSANIVTTHIMTLGVL